MPRVLSMRTPRAALQGLASGPVIHGPVVIVPYRRSSVGPAVTTTSNRRSGPPPRLVEGTVTVLCAVNAVVPPHARAAFGDGPGVTAEQPLITLTRETSILHYRDA
jgi:hypothetical protein